MARARVRRCQFCQKMEEDFEAFAGASDVAAYKFRGDEQRAYVEANMNTASFPTINFLSADGKLTKYESEDRSPAALNAFIASQKATA